MENDKKDYQATISLQIKAGLKHVWLVTNKAAIS